MIQISSILNWFTPNETSTNLRQEANEFEEDWCVISSEKPSLSKPLLDAITGYLPELNPSHFTECLGQFKEMELMCSLQNSELSKTLLVAIKNQAQEVHTFALRILNSDKTKRPQLTDRYFYLREGMMGAEWDRFLNDERLIYAIGRDTRGSNYRLISRYNLQKLPYKGPEYKLFATLALYEENDDSFETPLLALETAKALENYLPCYEPDLFSYC
ncbi:MAG: hypothetical protein HRU43_05485, partial [Simkaniaceae bacterium]|nr:hypothetical protein [Simkaniaceae bacterium]